MKISNINPKNKFKINKSNKNKFKNSPEYQKLATALAKVKQINLTDLKNFLAEDQNSFSVLTLPNMPTPT